MQKSNHKIKSIKYKTAGGVCVSREVTELAYKNASKPIIEKLNECKGVLLSSSFEFPGRYTRWDVGFINPPIMMSSEGRCLTIIALNKRGDILLQRILLMLELSDAVGTLEITEDSLRVMLKPAEPVFFEEDRSRQVSVFSIIRELVDLIKSKEDRYLGLYGAFGYELAFQFEAINFHIPREQGERELVLYLPDEILVVDHQKETAQLYFYEFEVNGQATHALERSGSLQSFQFADENLSVPKSDHQVGEFASTVRKAREYFARGDLFEAVPGQMFLEKCIDRPSDIFLRLQKNNPAPYGALINLGEQEYLIAASPEMYVRVKGDRVETCPISGTIARGKDAIEDAENIKALLNSAKEESELSMCTDVDRNDKSRVCEPGTVKVIGRRQLELYSRLIHTVDHVEGKLKVGFDALDAFLSHTWAVTVTGAPKQAAIQFIEEHEKSPRHWYGGAMGFVGFDGNMNTGLTLRTMRIKKGIAEIRAGATLLYDSDPQAEEAETRLKASALLSAIRNTYQNAVQFKEDVSKKYFGIEILMVDHQDSFVHTLSAYFQELGARVKTVRHEGLEQAFVNISPDLVVLSPGPGKPADFNLSRSISLCLRRKVPLFGVCLGLQGIVEYFGGSLRQLEYPMHGKPSVVEKVSGVLFEGVEAGFQVGRYHSLVAHELPDCLRVTASTEDDVVMAIEHKQNVISAVQFHPESILSLGGESGRRIIANVLACAAKNSNKNIWEG